MRAPAFRASTVRELKGPVGEWLKFHVTSTGRIALAYPDADQVEVAVFAPIEGARALMTAHAEPGARFTGGVLFGEGGLRLATSDDQGRITTHAARGPARTQQSQPVLTAMDVSVQRDQFAVGLGVMWRVRIVPVGSTEAREIPVDGSVIGVASHVTNAGRHLLAVATETQLKVYDVLSLQDEPVYATTTTSPATLFEWAIDDRGESVLVYVDGGSVVVRNPIAPNPVAITASIGGAVSLQTLNAADGALWILANRGEFDAPELLVLREGRLTRDERLRHVEGRVALIAGPGEAASVAYRANEGQSTRVVLARLANPEKPLHELDLAPGEEVVAYGSRAVSARRSLLAIGTNRAAYVLKLEQAAAAGRGRGKP